MQPSDRSGAGSAEATTFAITPARSGCVVRAKVVSRRVDFRILGPLEVWQDCEPMPLTGTTQRALLGILLLHRGEVVAADRLMDDLWGEDQPASGVTALHVRVSQLRKALGPAGDALVTRPPG